MVKAVESSAPSFLGVGFDTDCFDQQPNEGGADFVAIQIHTKTDSRKNMNAKLTIENINPSRASELLQNIFEGQRHIRQSHVDRLALEITEGRWHLSPDAILIAKGKLANGQHRLSAVIEARKAAPFIIMESNDEELYKVIDSGIKRTVADVLMSAENRNHLAAAAKWVVGYDKKCMSVMSKGPINKNGSTRSDVIEYAQEHTAELGEQVSFCLSRYREKPLVSVSLAAATIHLAVRKYPVAKVQAFVDAVYMGTSRDDAAWDLRERFVKNRASKSKLPQAYIFGLFIKALKSWIQGTRPGVLKLVDEFPEL